MRRAMQSGDRGMVLVITLMVVLALSVLGAVVIEATKADVKTAGFVRQAEQTAYVTEVGTMLAIRTFSANHSGYRRLMQDSRNGSFTFVRASFDPDLGTTTAPLSLINAGTAPGSLGYLALPPSYYVLVNRAREYGTIAGYSLPGTTGVSFCFRRYTFTTVGELTAGGVPSSSDSRSTMRATTVIGPTDCTL